MPKLANKWRNRLNTNELKKLLKKYPDKPWNWELISRSSGLELDMLTPECPVAYRNAIVKSVHIDTKQPYNLVDPNYNLLSMNKNISWQFVLENIEEAWDWNTLSMNPAITFEIMRDNPRVGDRHIPWSWGHASENPNVTPEVVRANREINGMPIPWDYARLSGNPSTTWEFVLSTICHQCQTFHGGWNWHKLSQNVATNEIVTAYPHLPWRLSALATNPRIDLETFIRCFYTLPGQETMFNSYDAPANWSHISRYKVKSIEDIKKYGVSWDWYSLSVNHNITLQDMLKHPEYPWKWQRASANINISLEDIKGGHLIDGEPIEWNWRMFSSNPFLTADIIDANPNESWDWDGISCNDFNNIKAVRERLEGFAVEEDVRIPLFLVECCEVLPPVLAHVVMEYDVGVDSWDKS